jgi:hypothetical protein
VSDYSFSKNRQKQSEQLSVSHLRDVAIRSRVAHFKGRVEGGGLSKEGRKDEGSEGVEGRKDGMTEGRKEVKVSKDRRTEGSEGIEGRKDGRKRRYRMTEGRI